MKLNAYPLLAAAALLALPQPCSLYAQQPQAVGQPAVAPVQPALRLDVPHSYNPFDTYRPTHVPAPSLANSPRLDALIHDGKLYLSLKEAIALAIENNLDLAIARYNIPIAAADVLRTRAGGSTLGVNTGVVQNTPGGAGASGAGAGAGGTSGGAGGAGSGASGLVESTLGSGSTVQSYDPVITGKFSVEHYTEPLSNTVEYGVQSLQSNTTIGDVNYQQSFPTGTTMLFSFDNARSTTNSPETFLNPTLGSNYIIEFQQQLLSGFGRGTNLRYLHIAKINQKISDIAFKAQVISTVTQIANMYWDLVSAYEDEQVKQRSLSFAQQMLDSGRQQLALQSIPAMDVLKSEGEVAQREEELTIAKATLRYQELLMKNAVTKNLDDRVLEAMPVVPMDESSAQIASAATGTSNDPDAMINAALDNRVELREADLGMQTRVISIKSTTNALLPTVALTGYYAGTGLGGINNPASGISSTAPTGFGGTLNNTFNNSSPDYFVGVNVQIPLRNRVAKSDQFRSELEYRQAALNQQQLKKQIRIEVRNAQYALEQNAARVEAARKARNLAQKSFDISQKEQALGAGSNLQTSMARRDLATAESGLVAAMTAQQKAAVEVYRASGSTLDSYDISIDAAQTGVSKEQP